MELDSQESPGEINSREVGLVSPSWMDCLASELFSLTVASRTLTSFRTAVETAISFASAGSPPP